MAKDTLKWSQFDGLDNVNRPEDAGPTALPRAKNIDINSAKKLSLRAGQTLLYSGAFHSLWSNGACLLAVKSGDLVSIHRELITSEVLRSGVGNNRMVYADINGDIYFTNDSCIGYIHNGAAFEFVAPTVDFRRSPEPGHLLEFFNGSLFVARENVIWFTDAFAFNRIDYRKNFKQLPSRLTMMRAVDDGMYLSDLNCVYFAQGSRPNKWALRKVCDNPAVLGSDTSLDGKRVKADIQGRIVFWLTSEGVHMGTNGGQVVNLTSARYTPPACSSAASLFKGAGDLKQVIISIQN
jgi:hypothetical protein